MTVYVVPDPAVFAITARDADALQAGRLDLFKPVATFMGGLALVHFTNHYMDVALAQAGNGGVNLHERL